MVSQSTRAHDSLEVRELTRTFGDLTAVDAVTMTVPAGRMVGFVGGNGAGKTTTMRMIMGVLEPDQGTVTWGGEPVTLATRATFGYMPEERGLYPKQKVVDQLVYLARLRGVSAADARRDATAYLDQFGLGDRVSARLETLSLGNQQRVQIIAAIMADPVLLVLDEPFSGLDPEAVDAMVSLLRGFTDRGVPVLFSSHQLDLVERLCDSIVVLSRGRVVAAGTPDELRATAPNRWRIAVGDDAEWVRTRPGLRVTEIRGNAAVVEPTSDEALQALLAEAVDRGTVWEFRKVLPSLSEIYRGVTT